MSKGRTRTSNAWKIVGGVFYACSSLCLVLTFILLVRSIWRTDLVTHRWCAHRTILWFDAGFVDYQYDDWGKEPVGSDDPAWNFSTSPSFWHLGEWKMLGFQYENATFPGGIGKHMHIGVPYWFLLVLLGMMHARLLIRWMRLRRESARRRLGLCIICGYNLTASRDRCPECGTSTTHGD